MKQVVCKKDAIRPGQLMEVMFNRLPVVVCRTLDDQFYAFSNRCVHQGAPMSKGSLCGTSAPTETLGEYNYVKEGEILRCPWHGREFDVKNEGRMLADEKCRLGKFQVSVEGDEIIIYK